MQAAATDGVSTTHLVLIPSYNTGPRLLDTVSEALAHHAPVWVVIDGSTDGSAEALSNHIHGTDRLRLFRRASNGGKGAAVLDGLRAATAAGFTHVLVMDADGQHLPRRAAARGDGIQPLDAPVRF